MRRGATQHSGGISDAGHQPLPCGQRRKSRQLLGRLRGIALIGPRQMREQTQLAQLRPQLAQLR